MHITVSYIFRQMISSLFMPLTVFSILLLVALLLFWIKKNKGARIVFIIAMCWLAAISFSPLPDALVSSLENRHKPFTGFSAFRNDTAVNIMVLGGGHTSDPALPASNQLSGYALGRLAEGIRIHRMLPGSRLITSGWQANDPVPQALVLQQAAMLLGVLPADIVTFVSPVNTEEEAQCYASRFGTKQKLIVVTDAAHMPRAIMWFHKAGLHPVAAPTNHLVKHCPANATFDFLPSSFSIAKMEYAVHEYIGIGWCWWKGSRALRLRSG